MCGSECMAFRPRLVYLLSNMVAIEPILRSSSMISCKDSYLPHCRGLGGFSLCLPSYLGLLTRDQEALETDLSPVGL
jgi:hypothetical protein